MLLKCKLQILKFGYFCILYKAVQPNFPVAKFVSKDRSLLPQLMGGTSTAKGIIYSHWKLLVDIFCRSLHIAIADKVGQRCYKADGGNTRPASYIWHAKTKFLILN